MPTVDIDASIPKDVKKGKADVVRLDVIRQNVTISDDRDSNIDTEEKSFSGEPPRQEPGMKDYVDARIEAVESRIDAKLERISAKLDTMPTYEQVFRLIVGVVAAGLLINLGFMAFANDRLGVGLGLGPAIDERMKPVIESSDKKFQAIESRLIEYKTETDAKFQEIGARMDNTDQTLEEIKQLIKAQQAKP